MTRNLTWRDRLVSAADEALRTLAGPLSAPGASPTEFLDDCELDAESRIASIELMRVNHAGEIAAQALYQGQAVFARGGTTRKHLLNAAREEHEHLAWCRQRLTELEGRPSALVPAWYAGAFVCGLLAGAAGDRTSLGFIAETESQVEAHIKDHLQRLPADDRRSAAILERMAADEAHHGTTARLAGGVDVPRPVRVAMAIGGEILRRVAAKV
jgi:ubiquinone biosynthesis monooxygenase Coq7